MYFSSSTAEAAEPPRIDSPRKYESKELYPQSVFLEIGLHDYFSQNLEKVGRKAREGRTPGRPEFEYAMDKDFSKVEMASSSLGLGYAYRFHRRFKLAGRLGFFQQERRLPGTVGGYGADETYRITGVHLDASARLMLPVSKVDFFLGAGPDLTYVIQEFRIRGSVTAEKTTKEYNLRDKFQGFAPGGHAEAGIDIRVKDNWSIMVEYRPSYAPAQTHHGPFNYGGHFAYLGTAFHF
jgi:opacity protein-like surface antigen